jgi:ribosome maturation factor RimP
MDSQVPHEEYRMPDGECRVADGGDQTPEPVARYSAFRLPPEVAEPIAAAAREAGVEVYHAEMSGRELRVQVETAAGASVDTCSSFSRALAPRLDAINFMNRQYTLEVSSPGIERRLYQPQDYTKAVGKHVKVLARDGWVEGRLETVEPNGITLRIADAMQNAKGKMQNAEPPATAGREVAYSEIREAHIRVPDCELFARGRVEPRNPESNHHDTKVTKRISSSVLGSAFVSLCLCGEFLVRFGVERIK